MTGLCGRCPKALTLLTFIIVATALPLHISDEQHSAAQFNFRVDAPFTANRFDAEDIRPSADSSVLVAPNEIEGPDTAAGSDTQLRKKPFRRPFDMTGGSAIVTGEGSPRSTRVPGKTSAQSLVGSAVAAAGFPSRMLVQNDGAHHSTAPLVSSGQNNSPHDSPSLPPIQASGAPPIAGSTPVTEEHPQGADEPSDTEPSITNEIIARDYDLTGLLLIELGGTSPAGYDQLLIDGDAFLNGTIEVVLVNGFVPLPNDFFDIIVADSLEVGELFAIIFPALSEGHFFRYSLISTGDGHVAYRISDAAEIAEAPTVWGFGIGLVLLSLGRVGRPCNLIRRQCQTGTL